MQPRMSLRCLYSCSYMVHGKTPFTCTIYWRGMLECTQHVHWASLFVKQQPAGTLDSSCCCAATLAPVLIHRCMCCLSMSANASTYLRPVCVDPKASFSIAGAHASCATATDISTARTVYECCAEGKED
ncbi:TPA: hypothetical protein ACH3X2_008227 [Trebouxia sp. C0005]